MFIINSSNDDHKYVPYLFQFANVYNKSVFGIEAYSNITVSHMDPSSQ